MHILLHACCAPCASHCIEVLRQLGHDVHLFYSNSNIAPHAEYLKRLDALKRLATLTDTPFLVDESAHDRWLAEAARGFEQEKERGARCERCFRFSLLRTHEAMLAHGFEGFTTSLSVSPHKHTPTIFAVGQAIDAQRFLAVNFKKDNGYAHSIELSKRFGLYRQNYCGCEFSNRTQDAHP